MSNTNNKTEFYSLPGSDTKFDGESVKTACTKFNETYKEALGREFGDNAAFFYAIISVMTYTVDLLYLSGKLETDDTGA